VAVAARLIPYCRKTTAMGLGDSAGKSPSSAWTIYIYIYTYDVLHLFTIDLTRDGHGRLLVPRMEEKEERERERGTLRAEREWFRRS
jgi:hypothetical protein